MERYDVVVIGARCAGAALARLLALGGARVLVVDRAEEGSDTLSTHAMMRGAVILLEAWGLLERLEATGTPPVTRTLFHYGDEVQRIDTAPLYAPRRTVLDPLLEEAAREAGAELRFGTHARSLRRDDDGRVTGVVLRGADGEDVEVEARWTIGADGRTSWLAHQVDAAPYVTGTNTTFLTYTYVRDVSHEGFHWYFRDGTAAGVIPTTDGHVLVSGSGAAARRTGDLRGLPDHGLLQLLGEAAPALAAEVAATPLTHRVRAYPGVVAYLRPLHGPGWVLVGDAAHFKDPATAHGITDAFRDAAFVAPALLAVLDGADAATVLGDVQTRRDELALPILDATERICSLTLPHDEMQRAHLDLATAMKHENAVLRELVGAGS